MVIYDDLDKIVKTNDYHHSRIEQLKTRMSNWIFGSNLPQNMISLIIAEIASAPVPAFRPELWKINLQNIHVTRLINPGQFPDEYQIRGLVRQEIEVIVQ